MEMSIPLWIVYALCYVALSPVIIFVSVCLACYLVTLCQLFSKLNTKKRPLNPDAILLLLVPGFNLIWHPYLVLKIARLLDGELKRRRIREREQGSERVVGVAMIVLNVASIAVMASGLFHLVSDRCFEVLFFIVYLSWFMYPLLVLTHWIEVLRRERLLD